MAVDQNFIDYVVEQMGGAGSISYRKMFGGCAVYFNKKVIALIGDDQLFIKPTEEGRKFIGDEIKEASPYPGAKKHFLVNDRVDDSDWLSQLAVITAQELPEPKPRKKKKE